MCLPYINVSHIAANACLTPVAAMHGMAVTTVEGIGSNKTKLHPVQERIAKAHGSQCGFCTPGIVMSMYALLRSKPKPSMNDMEVAFQGSCDDNSILHNICTKRVRLNLSLHLGEPI